MKKIGVGLIGTGYMGKAHAIAYSSVRTIFSLDAEVVCESLFDPIKEVAKEKAYYWGFRRYTDDWRTLINDPSVDVVDICSPNFLHKQMAMEAIAAGKHVYCEKPLALNSKDALELSEAAEEAGVKTLVGFNHIKNPAVQFAKQIIESGEIGEILSFRGTFNEDYLADKNTPFSWRLQKEYSGSGSLADLNSHLINAAQYLVSPIKEVLAEMNVFHDKRPLLDGTGGEGRVENDDQTNIFLRFESGAFGSLESSRVAWGRKNGFTFEINGSEGTIVYDQESLSELKLYKAGGQNLYDGFKRILIGPQHPDYGNFCVAAGHGIGYNDMKAVEIRDLVIGISEDKPIYPDFRAGYEVNLLMDAAEQSFLESRWVQIGSS